MFTRSNVRNPLAHGSVILRFDVSLQHVGRRRRGSVFPVPVGESIYSCRCCLPSILWGVDFNDLYTFDLV